MTNEKVRDLRAKILKGIKLSYSRLLVSKQKEDGELVFSQNGKIVTVKIGRASCRGTV